SWLDPDEGINVLVASVGGWADTEARVGNVAPVTTLETNVLLTGAALVNDELGWETLLLEVWGQGSNVAVLRPVLVVWSGTVDSIWGGRLVGVVVGDVGSETSALGSPACPAEDLLEELGRRLKVVGPSEPVGVGGIDVE